MARGWAAPNTGDVCLKPGQNEMMVWEGSEWITCSEPFDSTSELYFKNKFDEVSELLHNKHPALKAAWDEYNIIRELLGE